MAGAGTGRQVEQVLHVPDTRDLAHLAFDALDLLSIVELPAQDNDPAIRIDADLSLGNRPVAEQLTLHLAHETDIVQLHRLVTMRNRVPDPGELAGLVMGLALDPASTAVDRGSRPVANKVPSPLAAARVQEELKRDTRREGGHGDLSQLTR